MFDMLCHLCGGPAIVAIDVRSESHESYSGSIAAQQSLASSPGITRRVGAVRHSRPRGENLARLSRRGPALARAPSPVQSSLILEA
jgi:hypothetical protein